jgi:hypothetical protein
MLFQNLKKFLRKKFFEILFSYVEVLNDIFKDLRRVAGQKFFRILVELEFWSIFKKKLLKKLLNDRDMIKKPMVDDFGLTLYYSGVPSLLAPLGGGGSKIFYRPFLLPDVQVPVPSSKK